jgi:hypothetical protein
VLDAVARQDGAGAMSALSEHIQASQRERLNDYDEWRRASSLRNTRPVFFDIHKVSHGRG